MKNESSLLGIIPKPKLCIKAQHIIDSEHYQHYHNPLKTFQRLGFVMETNQNRGHTHTVVKCQKA